MTDANDSLSVDLLAELGRISVTSPHVEWACSEIARALNLDPGTSSFSRIAKAIRARVGSIGVPSWATVTPDTVVGWCEQASNVMDRRNTVLHALHLQMPMSDEWVNIMRPPKLGHDRPPIVVDLPRLSRITADLRSAASAGWRVMFGLFPMVRLGVYMRCLPQGTVTQTYVVETNGAYAPRPSTTEMEDFERAFDIGLSVGPDVAFRYPPSKV